MDWNDIRHFMAVARTGGLTPAAQELEVSPATVSRRIDAFEQSVGMTLFLRRQTGYVLTDEGEHLFKMAQPVEQAMLGFARQTQGAGQPGQWTGTVRVATSEAVATCWITPLLAGFLERHKGLQIELITGAGLASLSRRDADIALRMSPPAKEEEGEYVAQHVGAMAFAAYMRRDVRDKTADWRSLPYASWSEPLDNVPMAKWAARHFSRGQPLLLTNSMNVQAAAAACGLTVSVIPTSMGDADPDLVRVEPGHFVCSRDLWLVFHRDLRDSQRVMAVRDFLADVVERHRSRD
jgi:DNA-binding transcriptional LysR family regulator